MKSKAVLVLVAIFALSMFAYAQTGPAGKWTGETQGRGGPQPITLELKVSGSTVTGSYQQGDAKADITEGKVVDANTVQFKRSQAGRGGGEPVVITVTGKIEGDKMTLTNEFPAGAGGGGGGGRGPGGGGGGGGGGAPGGGAPGGGGGGGGRGGGGGGGGGRGGQPIVLTRSK